MWNKPQNINMSPRTRRIWTFIDCNYETLATAIFLHCLTCKGSRYPGMVSDSLPTASFSPASPSDKHGCNGVYAASPKRSVILRDNIMYRVGRYHRLTSNLTIPYSEQLFRKTKKISSKTLQWRKSTYSIRGPRFHQALYTNLYAPHLSVSNESDVARIPPFQSMHLVKT
jgi:hypothetical protein